MDGDDDYPEPVPAGRGLTEDPRARLLDIQRKEDELDTRERVVAAREAAVQQREQDVAHEKDELRRKQEAELQAKINALAQSIRRPRNGAQYPWPPVQRGGLHRVPNHPAFVKDVRQPPRRVRLPVFQRAGPAAGRLGKDVEASKAQHSASVEQRNNSISRDEDTNSHAHQYDDLEAPLYSEEDASEGEKMDIDLAGTNSHSDAQSMEGFPKASPNRPKSSKNGGKRYKSHVSKAEFIWPEDVF